jgi:23S rRNA pseudouridine1911/1915/1917 synthase
MLLQRLDFGTSGLLCAALSPAAAAAFRAAEAKGHCEKRYVALLTGVLTGPITARQSLGVSGRRKSRLRDAQADKTRWTDFWPLHVWHPDAMDAEELRLLFGVSPGSAFPLSFPPQGLTLAACRIRRGARHQIRVHAAGLGHALWGDALYADGAGALPQDSGGVEPATELHGFFLHHGGLRLPGAACVDYPPWPLPEALSRLVRAWFEGVLPQAGH